MVMMAVTDPNNSHFFSAASASIMALSDAFIAFSAAIFMLSSFSFSMFSESLASSIFV